MTGMSVSVTSARPPMRSLSQSLRSGPSAVCRPYPQHGEGCRERVPLPREFSRSMTNDRHRLNTPVAYGSSRRQNFVICRVIRDAGAFEVLRCAPAIGLTQTTPRLLANGSTQSACAHAVREFDCTSFGSTLSTSNTNIVKAVWCGSAAARLPSVVTGMPISSATSARSRTRPMYQSLGLGRSLPFVAVPERRPEAGESASSRSLIAAEDAPHIVEFQQFHEWDNLRFELAAISIAT